MSHPRWPLLAISSLTLYKFKHVGWYKDIKGSTSEDQQSSGRY